VRRREFLKVTAGSAIAATTAADRLSAKTALPKVDHFVVLMLENRSFDNLLGRLYPRSATFDGLTGSEFNLDLTGKRILINNQPGNSAKVMTIPSPGPGERWTDINEQLFGKPDPPAGVVPGMSGFVRNYLQQKSKGKEKRSAEQAMHYFTPEQTPVISQLARQFAVSDRWFASAPTQTWPNRFFLHTGTANGHENNAPPHFPYSMPTIFERFQTRDADNGWRIYFHDVPHSATLARLWQFRQHFRRFARFLEDAQQGKLPSYAFIEPDYLPFLGSQSDEHPPSSVAAGEQLLASVYNALRQGPAWKSTLLVVIFDEHGGCYDHVPPPSAVPPSKIATSPFNFDRYGVRVPAIFVSPYIKQGQVLRPTGATPFDHTSVIATLRKRFALGPALTDRDAAAPTFDDVLNLPAPTNLGPERISAPPVQRERAAGETPPPLTDLQSSLVDLAVNLPNPGDEQNHIRHLETTRPRALDKEGVSPAKAGEIVDKNTRRFLGES
jgi:phospholipase C